MNRTFDYQWNRYDIETKDGQQVGNVNWTTAGAAPATEPEIKALQQFLYNNEIDALVSLHTGIQGVLYPWCYRAYDENDPDDAGIPFMKETEAKMAQVFQDYTGCGFYSMSSNEDYPTAAELIDYAYGRYNIHAYTIKVYSPGKSEDGESAAASGRTPCPKPSGCSTAGRRSGISWDWIRTPLPTGTACVWRRTRACGSEPARSTRWWTAPRRSRTLWCVVAATPC